MSRSISRPRPASLLGPASLWGVVFLLGSGCEAPNRVASQQATAEIREADLALARAVAEGDVDGFGELIAEDAVFHGSRELRSREGVVAGWRPLIESPDISLTWTPDDAGASSAGDFGYTSGRYELRARDASGAEQLEHGRYVSLWRRDADGQWRAIFDIGRADDKPPPAEKD
ncbi:MAG: nuclear transport factor 2 family protein [Acidobacteriota bacterium]|nr:MAG: nuclear transport factor 2 family protein [Acidobacteriota bacterium]